MCKGFKRKEAIISKYVLLQLSLFMFIEYVGIRVTLYTSVWDVTS
jgi:hypothetical protein